MHLIQTFTVNIHWAHSDANCLLTFCVLHSVCLHAACIVVFADFPPVIWDLSTSFISFLSLVLCLTQGSAFLLFPSSLCSAWQAVLSVSDLFCLCTSLPNLFYETLHLSKAFPLPWRDRGGEKQSKITGRERAKSSARKVAKWSGCTHFPSLSSYITVITLPKPLLETS